ncbi:MAG: hypothetical protein RRZ64_07895 [Rikenellaceae bacterium]
MKIITVFDIENNTFLIKPDTALLRNNDPYYIPSFTKRVEARPYILVKIVRLAKSIDATFASRLWESLSVAVEFAALDVLEDCKKKSLPWDAALSYDKSTAVSNDFVSLTEDLRIDIQRNESTLFCENMTNISDTINTTLSKISHLVTLKIGDMVILPLGRETVEVKIGDYITATCNDTSILDFDIK